MDINKVVESLEDLRRGLLDKSLSVFDNPEQSYDLLNHVIRKLKMLDDLEVYQVESGFLQGEVLRACPRCGSDGKVKLEQAFGEFYVICDICWLEQTKHHPTRIGAYKDWNNAEN